MNTAAVCAPYELVYAPSAQHEQVAATGNLVQLVEEAEYLLSELGLLRVGGLLTWQCFPDGPEGPGRLIIEEFGGLFFIRRHDSELSTTHLN